MERTFASLMVRAFDEPDAMYGLAARAVRISPDGLTYRFHIRSDARFHDGSKLDAHDVAFSLNAVLCLAALFIFWRALPTLRAAARPVYVRLGLIGGRDEAKAREDRR